MNNGCKIFKKTGLCLISLGLVLAQGILPIQIFPLQQAEAVKLRIKDITHIKGVRNNQLVGYGLVVGLNKTGDKSKSTTNASYNLIQNMGGRLSNENDIRSTNSAAVMVTALIPPFAKAGDPMDVMVSSLADAKSLEGGVLINTQLVAPNGEVVALAQGPVSVGGTSVEAGGSSKRTAIVTSGRVPGGAIIEREISTDIGDNNGLDLVMDRTDFTLAAKIAKTISAAVGPARALDGSTIRVEFSGNNAENRVGFISAIENLEVESQLESAKIIVNERTGTIVIGSNVRLLPAAVAHGGITVSVTANNAISQPNALTNGQTAGVSNSQIKIEEKPGSLVRLNSNSTLQDLVTALNAIGVTPNDLISILQALKAAGSLEATIEII
jgi:flagellar P-ring protein FlgI